MMLPLPSGDFQAYLFDCDGTIVDSMPQHYTAWRQALDEWGCEFPEELFYAWAGRPTADIVAALNDQQRLNMPLETVVARREALFQQLLPTAAGIPGVLHHIDDAHGRIPFAVVSGSTREAVTASLDALGILDRFDVLVCAGDYTRPKPDPEPFLRAAELLGVPPRSCLVFEDADLGIEAATAAGMAAVRVPQPRQG
ncbi:HAD family hydrolase [Micromonospora radicis]|uniref:HAD family hydrolase n=2 Tax=Micromonospora radicis TaxID=1894971 RepID=A0A418MYG5_9ACTN|nr:HAD-IA family hydrolase [Micromonospora radicis]RIV39987.1 HAD family hydrolase [Micromonospora radicis]